jgi:hypothetical protein
MLCTISMTRVFYHHGFSITYLPTLHDDIVHKIDAAGFRILVSIDFYVSHIPTFTIAQSLHCSPCIANSIIKCAPICYVHNKKQSRLFIDPDAVWQVEFDFAVNILKESLKDHNIT